MQGHSLIPKDTVASMFGKPNAFTRMLASMVMKVTGIAELNRRYSHFQDLSGKALAHQALISFGVSSDIPESCLANIPPAGPCIIVCNHPFGLIDGLTVIDRVTDLRPDVKVLTNFLLSSMKDLEEYFLPVNPFTDKPGLRSSVKGLKMAKEHLENGGVLVLFPSGEVSSDCNEQKIVKDIPWQVSMMKLIKRSGVPVIPFYFHGQNSQLFHKLGHINPSFRTVRLVREALNKEGLVIPVRIGKPVKPSEYSSFEDLTAMASWLYARTYILEAEINSSNGPERTDPVRLDGHIPQEDLVRELEKNASDLMFHVDHYSVYLSQYKDIPFLIKEIGVCREETFRAVGEGTGTECDLDRYDEYYRHLYVWDTDANELVGAYRVGFGYEILPKYGIAGLYTDSLFRFDKSMESTLMQTMECGRSFIVTHHQKSALPLMLLIKGILATTLDRPQISYFCGPVTTSGAYPLAYRSIILRYLEDCHMSPEFKGKVNPLDPFVPDFGRADYDALVAGKDFDSPEQFDRFLSRLGTGSYRMPTLVKKYLKFKAFVLGFNVDPLFNYCVDSLILLPLSNFPKSEIDQFFKDDDERKAVYDRFGTI